MGISHFCAHSQLYGCWYPELQFNYKKCSFVTMNVLLTKSSQKKITFKLIYLAKIGLKKIYNLVSFYPKNNFVGFFKLLY